MAIGGVRAALRFTRRRSVRIAAIATAVLVVGGVGVAVASTGGHRAPEAVSDTSVEDSPSPSSEPTSPEADTDSSDSGGEDSGLVSLGGPIDDSSGDTDTDTDSYSSDDTDDDSSDSTAGGAQEPAAGDDSLPAPLGSLKGVWWSPGDAFTSSRLWVFDGSGHGSMKNFQRTGIDGPVQYPNDFTYESGGSDVRLSLGSVTSISNHEVVLTSLSYDSSTDTLSLNVDGSALTWFGCSSNRQDAVAAALCG